MQLCESKDVKGYKPCPLTTWAPLLILIELTSSTPKAKVIDTKYYKQLVNAIIDKSHGEMSLAEQDTFENAMPTGPNPVQISIPVL